jgi:type IX secretion system PorP/SprF family membrane protein
MCTTHRWCNAVRLGCAVLLLLMGLHAAPLRAQDPILSQYFANPLYLNPALAGYEEGLQINTAWREQWFRIDGVRSGYSTGIFGASLNLPQQQSGLGLSYVEHAEGPGRLHWRRVGLAYAFRSRSCSNRQPRGEINFGLRLSVNGFGLSGQDAFEFGDEFHPILGNVYQTAAPQEFLDFRGRPFADFDAGVYYTLRTTKAKPGKNPQDNFSQFLRLGFAVHHLPGRPLNRIGRPDILPMRFTLHGDYVINQGGYQFIPMLKIEGQSATSNLLPARDSSDSRFWFWSNQIGVMATALGEIDRGFWGGIWYHGRLFPGYFDSDRWLAWDQGIHSLILAAGCVVPLENTETRTSARMLRFGISYDYQFAGLTNDGTGTLELSLSVVLGDVLRGSNLSCRSGPPCVVPF